jgi:uncharacterized protein YndB with AHSA1/START domain
LNEVVHSLTMLQRTARGMSMYRRAVALLLMALAGGPAAAELKQVDEAGFLVQHRYEIPAEPARSWAALGHPELWWPEDHTWSGSRANLSLAMEAGGCFCERWQGGSAEHARVVMARDGALLRLRGSLGPLQEMAVAGVLTIALEATRSGTLLQVSYRVSGDDSHRLSAIAPAVDQVIWLQFSGLAQYAARER